VTIYVDFIMAINSKVLFPAIRTGYVILMVK